MTELRQVDVSVDRLERWIGTFAERHGVPTWSLDAAAYLASAPDGAWATFASWNPPDGLPMDPDAWTRAPSPFVIILIRRGGYAVGWVEHNQLVTHKCGTRYVQSRTAAGGWSQQRYARRRSNQRDELVRTVAERAISAIDGRHCAGVVLGGDKVLATAVLEDPRLRWLVHVPRREFFDIPDPRLTVLAAVVSRAQAVAVTVSNGPR